LGNLIRSGVFSRSAVEVRLRASSIAVLTLDADVVVGA